MPGEGRWGALQLPKGSGDPSVVFSGPRVKFRTPDWPGLRTATGPGRRNRPITPPSDGRCAGQAALSETKVPVDQRVGRVLACVGRGTWSVLAHFLAVGWVRWWGAAPGGNRGVPNPSHVFCSILPTIDFPTVRDRELKCKSIKPASLPIMTFEDSSFPHAILRGEIIYDDWVYRNIPISAFYKTQEDFLAWGSTAAYVGDVLYRGSCGLLVAVARSIQGCWDLFYAQPFAHGSISWRGCSRDGG